MCGIFSLFNRTIKNINFQKLRESFMNGESRGPEYSALIEIWKNIFFGFHRLAINGLNSESHQPIVHNNIHLICNGEIYNYKQLAKQHNYTLRTSSDCEIIIHLYETHGFEYMVQLLDGVFAIQLLDLRNPDAPVCHIARDPFGVRPLFHFACETHFGFSSEMKTIVPYESSINAESEIKPFPPGHYLTIKYDEVKHEWDLSPSPLSYFSTNVVESINSQDEALHHIRESLYRAVEKRVDNTDRPIACLLSGGLDSSLICALVNKVHVTHSNTPLETYSIGLPGSVDLKYAKLVAEHIGSKHHEIIVTEEDFLSSIPEVVRVIESYDTTTVRASVGNYAVSKYIKNNSESKVIFNGDGSDEVCGGYMYFHCAPDAYHFDAECKRLLRDIHYFDVLRSDRSISSCGLEARTPFLDKNFVRTYLSINKDLRNHSQHNQCEKYLLRKAFDCTDLLPKEVLWRTKEAFSDGVSSETRSWYEIIQEYVGSDSSVTLDNLEPSKYNSPVTYEQKYYRSLFNRFYGPSRSNVIPYFWMPRFVENAHDASARTLDIYKKVNKGE